MTDYVYDIKHAVTMRQVCDMYGLEVNRAGFCLCPFHAEKTPSLRVYPDDRGYHCFGCGKSGDVISFVKDYFSLTFKEAIVRLNTDFNLRLPIDEKPTKEATQAANKRKRAQIAEQTAYKRLRERYDTTLDKFTQLDKKRITGEANALQGIITDEYADTLKALDMAKYELEEAEMELWNYEHRSRSNS